MATIYDFLKFNFIPFHELEKDDKERVERFVEKIKEDGLENIILQFDSKYNSFGWRETPSSIEFNTGLPRDLSEKMSKIWSELN